MNRPEIIEAIDTIGIQLKEMLYNLPDDTQLAVLNSIGKMLRLTTELSTKQVFPCTAVYELANGGYLRYDFELPSPPFADFSWIVQGINIQSNYKPAFDLEKQSFVINMNKELYDEKKLRKLGWYEVKTPGDAKRAK